MIEIVLLVILFLMGIYFGSFFTLATYRLPKKENILYKHSYCPSCKHKLGVLDLIPIFSYLALRGKCRYCKKKIGPRYFLFEFLTGIVFVLFGVSLKFDVYNLEIQKIIFFALGILYFASLFILAGIDKEKNKVQKSVLYFGIVVSVLYIIYSCTLNMQNVYKYVIYLFMMVILMLLDTVSLQKKLKYNTTIEILILILYMLVISGEQITILTLLFTLFIIAIENIFVHIKLRKSTKVITKKVKKPIVFYLCVSNIILIIGLNLVMNYMIK